MSLSKPMGLTQPVDRECVHNRTISLNGYRRADGLLDIEGTIKDVKTYDFPNRERGVIVAGEALHHMQVRITINHSLEIIEAEAATLAGPYAICPAANRVFHRLKGLTIGPGWRAKVRQAIGGVEGCTHITELMAPIATVAYQTLFGERSRAVRDGTEAVVQRDLSGLVNSCIGHADDPESVLAQSQSRAES